MNLGKVDIFNGYILLYLYFTVRPVLNMTYRRMMTLLSPRTLTILL